MMTLYSGLLFWATLYNEIQNAMKKGSYISNP